MLVVDSDPALWRGTGSNRVVSSRCQSPHVRPRRTSIRSSADLTCYSSMSSGTTAVYFKASVRDTPKGLRRSLGSFLPNATDDCVPPFGSPAGNVMRGLVFTSSPGINSPRRRMRKLKFPDLSNDDNYLSSGTCNEDGVFPVKKALSRPNEESSAHTEPTTSEEDDFCLLSSKHSPRRRGRNSLALPFIESSTSEEDAFCLSPSKQSPRRIVEPMTCKEDDVCLTSSKQSPRRRERRTAADHSELHFVELMASEEEGFYHSQSKQSPRRRGRGKPQIVLI
jgi:hypothetical protein